jgi:putative ABC transport system permease protein
VPLAVGVVLALLLFATLAHTVLSTMRRRQIDLAVLRALGATRRQLESTMRWQTLMLIGSALVVGIPLGLIANRIAWTAFTDRVGVSPGTVTPLALLAVGASAVLVLGYGLATGVGRRASAYARTDPFVA